MSFAAVLQRLEAIENPYPGLRSFKPEDAHLFFGRDRQIGELTARLDRNRFIAIVGVSGSGKSSLVHAGLIPALERGHLADSGGRWRIVVTRPAGAPFANLIGQLENAGLDAQTLRLSSYGLIHVAQQLATDESLLVVVDQFEELFRYKDQQAISDDARGEREQAASEAYEFVQVLLAASRHQPPVYIVITMRSDYLGDCAEFPDLPEALNECQYLIPRLIREERKQAIECPLGKTEISPALVQRMLNDAGDEPDQLPILQHALMRTWDHWRKTDPKQTRNIELQDYEAIGGFDNVLDQHADELLEEVPQHIAATIFKRLTARGRPDRERREPAKLLELWDLCDAKTQKEQAAVTDVIDRFRRREATFLLLGDGDLKPSTYVDIAHESLIRQWKMLHDRWLPQETKSAKTFLDLVERSWNWKSRGGALLSGLDLADAVEWEKQRNRTSAWANHYANESALAIVLDFINTSQAEESKRTTRERRNFWIAVALSVVFGFVATIAGYEWIRARQSEKEIRSTLKKLDQAKVSGAEAVKQTAKLQQAMLETAAALGAEKKKQEEAKRKIEETDNRIKEVTDKAKEAIDAADAKMLVANTKAIEAERKIEESNKQIEAANELLTSIRIRSTSVQEKMKATFDLEKSAQSALAIIVNARPYLEVADWNSFDRQWIIVKSNLYALKTFDPLKLDKIGDKSLQRLWELIRDKDKEIADLDQLRASRDAKGALRLLDDLLGHVEKLASDSSHEFDHLAGQLGAIWAQAAKGQTPPAH